MNDLSMISTFALSAEKLGIIGFLVLFVIYFIYQDMTINKNLIKVVKSLDESMRELKTIFHQQLDIQNKFIESLRNDIKEIKDKTSEMHLHCKESANLIRKDYYK
ncbi:hypothetical protein CDQ71_00290 [Campylobacter hyointestinalis subsp. hyointestinalis]|uniref:Uncharacterized protein n=1 Tax=Campylobacter hyointestinalis subsp. hyointestinalis TaxID=91352 RepID=A0A9W5EX16_CAMHY|nr:hypothetical protein [Campylobacter hyointestinalis]PPB58770.1 hypothetical protein CDQ71_00290 [Campylobacter hyointestinalis subsp. hyointestinalis]PPB65692.1 hypothetical protein CDQ75_08865 [Campylobacter hyointestinalis subsp. hyointestinalis]TWO19269.1 hypothetical protein YZ80_07775 [Campylobacter hyointestinalis]CUU77688.1 Uncharacterised protein [Campylobacter hyointestinalis subsp. hyointestinalis]CUU91280.1 Uncharacterised protein [Campylobacter hyointestinalis subsp. hyointestin